MKSIPMKARVYLLILPFILILMAGCGSDSTEPDGNGTTGEPVSQVIGTSMEGTLTHPNGAAIFVPRYAVPQTADGQDGEMLFTIETGSHEDFGVPDIPPTDRQFIGGINSMGPESFIFDIPIIVTMPIPASVDLSQNEVSMYDYDREAGLWESVGGRVSEDGSGLSVDVLHLCANIIIARNISGRGHGAIVFDSINGYSFKLCIETYTLANPDWDSDFEAANRFRSIQRRDASTTPPDGLQYWILPQGTYLLSIAVYRHSEDPGERPEYIGYFQKEITIDRPHWDWENDGPDFEFSVPFGSLAEWTNPARLTDGRPQCMGSATPSVGIGSINVRLEWAADADIDLWVVDPCDNTIYYGNTRATCQDSEGELDLDNMCSNFVFGRPENIFWQTDPPSGGYKVYVDYFQDCADAGNVYYTVRWMVRGVTKTKRGTISPPASTGASGDEVLVTQFSY